MSNKAAENSQKVILLAGASVLALGVAGWQVVATLVPAPPVAVTVSTVRPVAKIAADPEKAASAASAQSPAASRDASRSEALLATDADPFFPRLTKLAQASTTAPAAPASSPASGAPSGPAAPALPRVAGVPSAGPFGTPPPTAKSPTPPVLVGTLLGEQSSAVFQDGHGVKIVPVGQKYGPWKVVSVDHGDALLRIEGHTLRLEVGEPGKEKARLTVGGSSSAHPTAGFEITVRAAEPAHDPAERMETMAATVPMRDPAEMADPFRNREAPSEAPQQSELVQPTPPTPSAEGHAAPEAPRAPTE